MPALHRDSTRAVLSALAARASIADALGVGAVAERDRGNASGAAAIQQVADLVRAGTAVDEVIEKLAFDPPIAGALIAAPNKDGLPAAAELALDALRGERKPKIPPEWIFATLWTSLVLIGTAAVSRIYIAPVLAQMVPGAGDPAFIYDAAVWMAMGAIFVIIIVVARRASDPLTGVSLLVSAFPFLVPLMYGRLEARARRRLLGNAGVLRMIAAGAAVGLTQSIVMARLRGVERVSGEESLASIAGRASAVSILAQCNFEGDDERAKLVRLARIARVDRPLADPGWLAVLGAMVLVIAACLIASYALISRIALLGGVLQ